MSKIILTERLIQMAPGRVDLPGKTDPNANKLGWRCYNDCEGKILHTLGIAIKLEFKIDGKKSLVWFVNKKSLAKRSIDDSLFTDVKLKKFVEKVRSRAHLPPLKNHQPQAVNPPKANDQNSKHLSTKKVQEILEAHKAKLIDCLEDREENIRDAQIKYFDQICEDLSKGSFENEDDVNNTLHQAMEDYKMILALGKNDYLLHRLNDQLIFSDGTPDEAPEKPQPTKTTVDRVFNLDQKLVTQNISALTENLIMNLEKKYPGNAHKKLKEENIEYFKNICQIHQTMKFKDMREFLLNINEAMVNLKHAIAFDNPSSWVLDQFNDNMSKPNNPYNIFSSEKAKATPKPSPKIGGIDDDHNVAQLDPGKMDMIISQLLERLLASLEKMYPEEKDKKLKETNIEYFRQICNLLRALKYANIDEFVGNVLTAMTQYKAVLAQDKPDSWILNKFNQNLPNGELDEYNISRVEA